LTKLYQESKKRKIFIEATMKKLLMMTVLAGLVIMNIAEAKQERSEAAKDHFKYSHPLPIQRQ